MKTGTSGPVQLTGRVGGRDDTPCPNRSSTPGQDTGVRGLTGKGNLRLSEIVSSILFLNNET